MKQCTRCLRRKNLAEFYNSKNRPDGKHPQCKPCSRESQKESLAKPEVRVRAREYQREFARTPKRQKQVREYFQTEKGQKVRRFSKLLKKYGITSEEYDVMWERQSGMCATCREPFTCSKHTHVDHDHVTGKVRGLLCNHCNRALGAVRDRVEVLQALIHYLGESHGSGDH